MNHGVHLRFEWFVPLSSILRNGEMLESQGRTPFPYSEVFTSLERVGKMTFPEQCPCLHTA